MKNNNTITKHTLFIGLNDKDTKQQKIAIVEAYKILYNILRAVGYEGATISEATGFYTHENGAIVVEKSLRVEVLFADDKKTDDLIQQLKVVLNQESIALQVENITSFLK
jgi:hypothetical protein